MTELYNVYEAKTRLSELLERAKNGEEIILAKGGKPYAMLTPIKTKKPKRVPGLGKGTIWYSDDCFSPMGEEELKEWYGQELPPLVK